MSHFFATHCFTLCLADWGTQKLVTYIHTHVCICSAVTEKKLNVDSTVLIMILPISVDVRSIGPCKAKRMDVFVCYHMSKLIEAL